MNTYKRQQEGVVAGIGSCLACVSRKWSGHHQVQLQLYPYVSVLEYPNTNTSSNDYEYERVSGPAGQRRRVECSDRAASDAAA